MKLRRLLALVLAFTMVLSTMGTAVFAEEADLTISSADALQAFAAEVNAGNSYEGKMVVLSNDIDMGYTAVVIGTKASPFKGTFDGQGYTVSNISIYECGADSDYFADSDDCLGLFGVINTPAVIKNVTVHNPYIVGSSYIGGIVGMGYTGAIENCHVTGEIDIEGVYMVGGINGHGYAKISDCSVIGVEGWDYSYVGATYKESDLEGDNVGGIVGHNGENNDIIGCEVKNITVSGTRKVGGIVGITNQGSDITDCVVSNVIVETTATAEYATDNASKMSIGGLVGQYQDSGSGGTISGCEVSDLAFSNVNNVTVSAGTLAGGLRGTNSIEEPTITVSENTISNVSGANNNYLVPETEEPDMSGDVAKVGDVEYADLQEAINAANGGTVTLLSDITYTTVYADNKSHWNGDLNYELNVSGDVTLDLNGYTIKTTGGSSYSYYAFVCVRSGSLTVVDSSEAKSGAIICSAETIKQKAYTIYNNAALVLNGGTVSNTVANYAIESVTVGNTSLTVNDGATVSSNGIAIRICSQGSTGTQTATINGGNISGTYAMWVPLKNGSSDVIDLTINGGSLTGSSNAILVNSYVNGDFTTDSVKINGGEFNGDVLIGSAYTDDAMNNALSAALAGNVISGGTFSNDVSDYVADGYELTANGDGTYGVVEESTALSYADFNEAIRSAAGGVYDGNGITVVLKDSERSYQNNKTAQFFIGATNVNITDPVETVKVSNVIFTFEDDDATNTYTSGELQVFAEYIEFTDCTFNGVAVSPWGISNDNNAESATFIDCTWNNLSGRYGVHQNRAAALTVTGCEFNNCERGIHTNSSTVSSITITNNTFTGIGDGYGVLCLAEGNGDLSKATLNISDNTAEGQVMLRQLSSTVTYEQVSDILDTNKNTYGTAYVSGSIEPSAPVYAAKIGDIYYETVQAAIDAAVSGETVEILPGEYGAINISNKNINIQGTVGDNGELLTTIKGGNPAITGHSFNGTIKDIKIVDAFKVMYAEPAGNVTVDNVYVTGATYGFHLVAYTSGLTWTIQNSYMDLRWANSFGVAYDGDAAIIIKGNRFETTNPYYPDYGAIHVNSFLPNVTVEENIFGENAKIYIDDSVTDTSNINISKNYHADGVDKVFAVDEDGGKTVDIYQYYAELNEDGTIDKDSLVTIIPPVAKVGDVEYASLQEAVDAAKAGDTITLLDDVTLAEAITLPAGIIFNGNGFAISSGIIAGGDITFAGITKAYDFDTKYTGTVINIGKGASLQLTGGDRLVVGHGCTFNIEGTITDAKTANVADITPSLIMPGASFTGAGVNFNVKNAYISVPSSYCSSSKSASGTFNFNIENSIWDVATNKLAFEAQSTAATVNFDLKDSVLTTAGHLVFGVDKGEIVIDNSNVNVGTSRQIENRSTMTIKNGSVVNGAVATSSNAINPGTLIVENATYAVSGEFSGSGVGTGTLIVKKGANVTMGKITKANIVVDATDMAVGDTVGLTTNLSALAGTLSVINNNLDAEIVDGKIVLVEKKVANVTDAEGNVTSYADIESALKALANGGTLTLLSDITIDYDWDCRDYGSTPCYGTFRVPVTIDGNGHKLIFKEKVYDGANQVAAFRFLAAATVKNLTIDMTEAKSGWGTRIRAISAADDLTVDNCTFIGNGSANNTRAIIFGEGAADAALAETNIVVTNSTFTGWRRGISDNENRKDVATVNIEGNTFNDANVFVSAKTSVEFNKNVMENSWANITSYSDESVLSVVAKENTLCENDTSDSSTMNQITNYATKDAQEGFLFPAAKIGDVEYTSFEEAVAASESGDTITLLADVEVTQDAAYEINFARKAVNIDGNGYKITQAADCDITWALLYYQDNSEPVTIKNLTFDGIKGGAAIWALNSDINVENCVFQNGEHTQIQGLIRTTGCNATITDSKFLDNECNMIISFNFDLLATDPSVDALKVQGCEFKNNTCADTAAIYFVKGSSSEISGNIFDNNTIETASHGAIAYYSEGQNGIVKDNVFSNNTIKAASVRAGVLILEAGTNASENAFVANNISSTASGSTYVGTIVNKADDDSEGITISANYWNGGQPDVANVKGAPTTLDNYYTTYENGVLGGLVEIKKPAGKVAYRAYVNDSATREGVQVDLLNVYAEESFVVKLLDAEGNLLTTTTLRAGGVEAESYTCNIVLWGSASGSWDTVISAEKLTVSNMPAIIEVWSDGVLVDTYENALGAGTNVDETAEYKALDCVYKAAKIDNTYYATLQDAVDAAVDGDVITVIADVEMTSSVEISGKTLTLDLGEYTIYDKNTDVYTSADDTWGLIALENNANLIVCGNGTIECNYTNVTGGWTGMAYCFDVDSTSEITINGGNFINGNGGIQTQGKVTVNAGTFVSHNGGTCIMALYGNADVTVNDGTFKDSVEEDDVYTGSGAVWSGFGATVNINGGTYDFAADPEHGNVVWTLFPAQHAIAGVSGFDTNMTVAGGTFVNFNPSTDVIVDYSASEGFTFGSVVADGYDVEDNGDGTYGIVVDPTYGKVAKIDNTYYATLEEAAAAIKTDGSDTTIKLLTDIDTTESIDFKYGTGNVIFTADEPVTVRQTKVADWAFTTGNDMKVIVDENVTFEIYDNNSGMYLYYGPSLELKGTITGGQNWGALYLYDGSHTVAETGKVNVGRVQLGFNSTEVKGEVDTNYLLVEGATFIADGAKIDANVIYDNNNGGQRWGASDFIIKNGSKVTTSKLTLSYADSEFVIDTTSSLVATQIVGAGKIVIDASAFDGSDVEVITADMSGFTGAIEVTGNDKATYKITENGLVVTAVSVANVAEVNGVGYETLQAAIDAAANGDTVTLISDLTIESDLADAAKGYFNIAADDKITLDLGGKTINVTDNSNGNFIVFYNYGDLTIKNGTVNLTATNDRSWNAQSTVILNRGGNLTIESGTYTHNGGTAMAITVDDSANSFGDAYMTVNGGEISSTYTAVRMRMADPSLNGNPGNGVAYMTVNGGAIKGDSRGIWGQITNASTQALGELAITGGTVEGGNQAINMTSDACENIEVTISGDAVIKGNISGDTTDYAITGGTFATDVSGYCADGYTCEANEDGTYGIVAVKLFTYKQVTASLDSSLAFNIYYKKSDLTETGYYAEIKQTKADGTVITTTIPEAEWVDNTDDKIVVYKGLAAKEMADNLEITLYNADGIQVSNTLNTSLKAFLLKSLEVYSSHDAYAKYLPVYIDALNYGAAAQQFFGYNTDNLANAGADIYQEHATKEYTIESNELWTSSGKYAFTTVSLENTLELREYFNGVTDDMYATYSYTTHLGTAVSGTVYATEFKTGWNRKYVTVPVAIPDANACVTVTLYDSNNEVVGTAVHSVEAYLKNQMAQETYDDVYPMLSYVAAASRKAFAK